MDVSLGLPDGCGGGELASMDAKEWQLHGPLYDSWWRGGESWASKCMDPVCLLQCFRGHQRDGIRPTPIPCELQVSMGWLQGANVANFRLEARPEDATEHWGWNRHDGRGFGISNITDKYNNFVSFVYSENFSQQDESAHCPVTVGC